MDGHITIREKSVLASILINLFFFAVHNDAKKNLVNNQQPSKPHAWSITQIYCTVTALHKHECKHTQFNYNYSTQLISNILSQITNLFWHACLFFLHCRIIQCYITALQTECTDYKPKKYLLSSPGFCEGPRATAIWC